MSTAKQVDYLEFENEYVESRLLEIKESLDSTPYNEIEDRIVSLDGSRGPADKVVATKEVQQKAYRESLKEYLSLMAAAQKLREVEAKAAVAARGNAPVSARVQELLNKA